LPIQAPCDGASRGEIDIAIIGSGMGGATFAAGLAASRARIVILERGERIVDTPETRDERAIFPRGVFRPKEQWFDAAGEAFNAGDYYYVGGNTKFYGAVLISYRAQDFRPIQYAEGATPGWPFDYDEIEPWYARAEALYRVRGKLGDDPTEPRHSAPYEYALAPDEPAIADVRERLARVGLSHRAGQAVRSAHAVASMRHDPHGRRSGKGGGRSVWPLVRTSQSPRR
jgi:choline dehydrogenase-like flavoprotein